MTNTLIPLLAFAVLAGFSRHPAVTPFRGSTSAS